MLRRVLFNHSLPGRLAALLAEAGLVFWLLDLLLPEGGLRTAMWVALVFGYASLATTGIEPWTWTRLKPWVRVCLLRRRDLVIVAATQDTDAFRAWVESREGRRVVLRPVCDPLRQLRLPVERVTAIGQPAGADHDEA